MKKNWMAWVLVLSCTPALLLAFYRQDWLAVTGWGLTAFYAFLYGVQSRQIHSLLKKSDELIKVQVRHLVALRVIAVVEANERLWRARS